MARQRRERLANEPALLEQLQKWLRAVVERATLQNWQTKRDSVYETHLALEQSATWKVPKVLETGLTMCDYHNHGWFAPIPYLVSLCVFFFRYIHLKASAPRLH